MGGLEVPVDLREGLGLSLPVATLGRLRGLHHLPGLSGFDSRACRISP